MTVGAISAALLAATAVAVPASATTAEQRQAEKLTQRFASADDADAVWRSLTLRERRLAIRAATPVTMTSSAAAYVCPDDNSDPTCYTPGYEMDAEAAAPTIDASSQANGAAGSLASSGCRSPKRPPRVEWKNVWGARLFGYYLDTNWCWSGNRITSFQSSPYSRIYAPYGWQFDKELLNKTTSSQDDLWYMHKASAQFSLCVGGRLGCFQHKAPFLKITVVKDGYNWDGQG